MSVFLDARLLTGKGFSRKKKSVGQVSGLPHSFQEATDNAGRRAREKGETLAFMKIDRPAAEYRKRESFQQPAS
jgi:hypothetical protein